MTLKAMNILQFFKKLLVILFLLIPLISFSQATKKQKEAEKKQEKLLKKEQKAELKGKKRQLQIQTKAVRKRMKKSLREAERINNSKRKPFWERMFIKKKR